MKTKADYLAANRQLAELFGWTKIIDAGGALLGTPTWVCDNSRSQVQIPDWCGQWPACGPLLAQLELWPTPNNGVCGVLAAHPIGGAHAFEWYRDHASPDAAVRYAIVQAAIGKLST